MHLTTFIVVMLLAAQIQPAQPPSSGGAFGGSSSTQGPRLALPAAPTSQPSASNFLQRSAAASSSAQSNSPSRSVEASSSLRTPHSLSPSISSAEETNADASSSGSSSRRAVSMGTEHSVAQGRQAMATSGVTASEPTFTSKDPITRLLHDTIATDDPRKLTGRELTLSELIPERTDKSRRLQIIKAYWHLAISTADYHFAVAETNAVVRVPAPRDSLEDAQWNLVLAATRAREMETKLVAVNAQLDLVEKIGGWTSEELPLAKDTPFVGRYETHYAQYAKLGHLPQGLRKIDRSLPNLLGLIEARFDAVEAAAQAYSATSASSRSGAASTEPLARIFYALRDQRIAMLGAIRDYNDLIAEYALSVSPITSRRDDLVAMLIEVKPASSAPSLDSSGSQQLRQANAQPNLGATLSQPSAWQPSSSNPGLSNPADRNGVNNVSNSTGPAQPRSILGGGSVVRKPTVGH